MKLPRILRSAACALLCCASTALTLAANLYVAPPPLGNNNNSGTSSSAPFATLAHAISQSSANDNIYLAAGDYVVASSITVPHKLLIQGAGSLGSNKTTLRPGWTESFSGFQSGTPVLRFTSASAGSTVRQIEFDGNNRTSGCAIAGDTGANNLLLEHNHYRQFYGPGVFLEYSSFATVRHSSFYRCAFELWEGSWGMLTLRQMSDSNFHHLTFESPEEAYGGSGYGIKAVNAITRCHFSQLHINLKQKQKWHDEGSSNFAIEFHNGSGGQMNGCTVTDSYFRNTTSFVMPASSNPSSGFSVKVLNNVYDIKGYYCIEATTPRMTVSGNWSKTGSFIRNWSGSAHHLQVHNNVAENIVDSFVKLTNRHVGVRIYNNTAVFGTTSGRDFITLQNTTFSSQSDDWQVHNNLIVGASSSYPARFFNLYQAINPTNFTAWNNRIHHGAYDTGPNYLRNGVNYNTSGAPGLTASGAKPSPWFMPAPGSPLINAGYNVGLPYNGSAPDVGALETGSVPAILSYRFDGSGTTAVASPGSTITAGLQLRSGTTAADHHVANAGPLGAGDGVFRASTGGMASGNRNGYLPASSVTALDGLQSFTITGWMRANATLGGGVVILQKEPSYKIALTSQLANSGSLDLYVNGATTGTGTNFITEVGTWVFFAVSYDGAATSNNLRYYRGTLATPVGAAVVRTLNQGAVGTGAGNVFIGNNANLNRAFGGDLDEISVHAGVLSPSQIEAVRAGLY
jgi:hypothetical protein